MNYYEKNREKLLVYSREYYQKNKAERNKKGYAWKRKNPEKVRGYKLMAKFGMTIEEYDKKLRDQNGCCDICGRSAELFKRRLHVDHNHTTGQTRGLLCPTCNWKVGVFERNFAEMSKYLNKYITTQTI